MEFPIVLFGEEMVCVVLGSTANGAQGAERVGLHLRNELCVWVCVRVYETLENITNTPKTIPR